MLINVAGIGGEEFLEVPKHPGSPLKKTSDLKNKYQREWYLKNRDRARAQNKAYRDRNKLADSIRRAEYHQSRKRMVLEQYGIDGEARCCWPGCEIVDLDVLSLDHVNNDGAKQRGSMGGGDKENNIQVYRWCIRNNFPPGFQTLCMNHQLKKHIQHVRAMRGY